MKVSELITQLQALTPEQQELPVCGEDYEFGECEIERVSEERGSKSHGWKEIIYSYILLK